MKIKLLALDMDGTACEYLGKLVESNVEPILKAQEMGVRVVFATGRPVKTSLFEAYKLQMDKYNQYFIGFNGACIYDIKSEEIVYKNLIARDELREIFKLANKYNVQLWAYSADLRYSIVNFEVDKKTCIECRFFDGEFITYENDDSIQHGAFKCISFDLDDNHLFVKELHKLNIVTAIDAHGCAEINAPNVNKYEAIKWICLQHSIDNEEVMALGDSMNDYEMIKNVGYGVAMGNAQQKIKDVAKEVTLTDVEGGVAHIINKYILNNA